MLHEKGIWTLQFSIMNFNTSELEFNNSAQWNFSNFFFLITTIKSQNNTCFDYLVMSFNLTTD